MSTTPTFVPGYMAAIEIGPDGTETDLTVVGRVLSLDWSRVSLPKPVFGQQYVNTVPGQISGSLSAGGHISVEILPELLPLLEADAPLPFTIVVGETGGTIDAGTYTGFVSPTGLGHSDDAQGEWEWTFDGDTDGPVTYTAPA